MDFHFAKHLSPLVLVSEREMSFDWAAISGSRSGHGSCASGLLCTGWHVGGQSLNGGARSRGCAMATGSYYKAPTDVHLTPSPVQGALPSRRVSCPLRAPP